MPENFVYRVGVNYWDSHGYGPTYASVRVFIYSLLVFETGYVELHADDMWEVCAIEWSSGIVAPVFNPDGGYKITPDYKNPYFLP